jgi:solute:Na+ symporter, SSS family
VLGLLTWGLFLATPAGQEFPAQLAGILAALTGMLIGSLGPQAIKNSHASHHKLAGMEQGQRPVALVEGGRL